MIQGYTRQLIEKAKEKKCDICDQSFSDEEAKNKEFHYSKTKRKSDIFIHKSCWDKMYRGDS